MTKPEIEDEPEEEPELEPESLHGCDACGEDVPEEEIHHLSSIRWGDSSQCTDCILGESYY